MKHAEYQLRGRESVRTGVSRIACAVVTDATRIIRKPTRHRDEDVHQVRLAIKSLRALLRLVQPPTGELFFKVENARLRTAAGRLAHLRDQTIARQTLEDAYRFASKKRERKAFKQVLSALGRQKPGLKNGRQLERAMVQAVADLNGTRQAFEQVVFSAEGWAAIGPGVQKTCRQARASMLLAVSRDRDQEYHEWRKLVKYLYCQLRQLESAWPGRLRKLCRRLKKLGSQLGDDHDLKMVKSLLTRAPENYGGRQITGPVIIRLDRRSFKLRRRIKAAADRLFREPPGKFVDGLKKHWRVWRSPKYR